MTKCKPPIFGDSAVLKKGLWVTLVIALVLALDGRCGSGKTTLADGLTR